MFDESKLEIRFHRVDSEVWRDRCERDIRSEADGDVDVVVRPTESHRHQAAHSRNARPCLTARPQLHSRPRSPTWRHVTVRMLERAYLRPSTTDPAAHPH